MLSEATIATFKSGLRGELIEPGDASYNAARKVYNAMIDRKPRLIVRCADVADVIAAVKFGREHKLAVSVRGGGHNAAGSGVCDDGLVIDLSPIKNVRVDPKKRTVLVGGGALWGDVDHATHAFGLAVPAGIISTTGVGGLTLGGGIGHLTRQCGLTIDNLLAVDMVLADGRFVTANEKRIPIFSGQCVGAAATLASSRLFSLRHIPFTQTMQGRCCGRWKTRRKSCVGIAA